MTEAEARVIEAAQDFVRDLRAGRHMDIAPSRFELMHAVDALEARPDPREIPSHDKGMEF